MLVSFGFGVVEEEELVELEELFDGLRESFELLGTSLVLNDPLVCFNSWLTSA